MKNSKKTANNILIYILLVAIAIFSIGPFLWLLSTSLKQGQNIYNFSIIPHNLTLANYKEAWTTVSIQKYLLNTVLITASGVFLNVILSTLTAYPLAKFDFPGKNIIFYSLISTMVLPSTTSTIINFLTLQKMHLVNSLTGVVLPSAVSVFNVFLMRQAYITVPKGLDDAARIDGASELMIWWKIMLPSVKPAMATMIILDFMSFWNSFMWPIIVLQDPDKYPLAAGINYLKGELGSKLNTISAGTIISIIPVILIFILFQQYFVEGMSGALKE